MQNMQIVLSHTCAILIIPTVHIFKYSSNFQLVKIECLFKIEITKNQYLLNSDSAFLRGCSGSDLPKGSDTDLGFLFRVWVGSG